MSVFAHVCVCDRVCLQEKARQVERKLNQRASNSCFPKCKFSAGVRKGATEGRLCPPGAVIDRQRGSSGGAAGRHGSGAHRAPVCLCTCRCRGFLSTARASHAVTRSLHPRPDQTGLVESTQPTPRAGMATPSRPPLRSGGPVAVPTANPLANPLAHRRSASESDRAGPRGRGHGGGGAWSADCGLRLPCRRLTH